MLVVRTNEYSYLTTLYLYIYQFVWGDATGKDENAERVPLLKRKSSLPWLKEETQTTEEYEGWEELTSLEENYDSHKQYHKNYTLSYYQ